MKRKEYLKPEMEVFQLQSKFQLLAGSARTMEIYDDDDDAVDAGYIL